MTKFDVALLLLRVSFGLSMAYHGLNKVRGNGLSGTATWFESIGMKRPRAQAVAAASTEIIGGLLLLFGLATPLACVMFVSLMIVAIWTVHWKVGYFIFLPNGGWEYCASIAAVATAIGLLGPGEISLDASLGISDSWGVFALPIGIIFAVCHVALTYRPKMAISSS
jgi:putative oxidoreductase